MKKKSPMQMKKAAPKNDAKGKMDHTSGKGARPKSAMERYADQRNASLRAAAMMPMMEHDPATDVHHLQKAAEINGDESRKRAARTHAAKKIKMLQKAMG
jgi:hypothetical protein